MARASARCKPGGILSTFRASTHGREAEGLHINASKSPERLGPEPRQLDPSLSDKHVKAHAIGRFQCKLMSARKVQAESIDITSANPETSDSKAFLSFALSPNLREEMPDGSVYVGLAYPAEGQDFVGSKDPPTRLHLAVFNGI